MKYSIVIPLKDEIESLPPLIEEVETVMNGLGEPWELICINDGSVDGTGELLEKLKNQKTFLRPLHFTKNFGQSCAFDAGFKSARGEFVITLDGDGQNDPADIPKLIALSQQFDLVCGLRQKRKDSLIKRCISRLGNSVRRFMLQDGVPDTGCSLKLYRRSCLQQIKLYKGMHRFLPALFQIEGFRVTMLPVNHRPRQKGKTKYHFFNRSFNTIADLLAVRWMRQRHLNYKIK